MKRARKVHQAKPIPDFKPASIDLYKSLDSIPEWLKLLKGNDKSYQTLLDYIILEAAKPEEEHQKITIKAISEKLHTDSHTIVKWLNNILEDIKNLNQEKPDLFKAEGLRYEMTFIDQYTGKGETFTVWLNCYLHRGDQFNWPFITLRRRFANGSFWVYGIQYYFEKGLLERSITLSSQPFNEYENYLSSKARAVNVSSTELNNRSYLEVEDLLNRKASNTTSSFLSWLY